MMVNNSTNIKETNNHLSSQAIEYKQRPCHVMWQIQVLGWARTKNMVGLNRLMGFPHPSPLDTCISNGKTDIQIQAKTCTASLPLIKNRGRRGHELTTTYAISTYHHWCCDFESRPGRGVQHYVIKFVSDLWQVGGFLRVLLFSPPIKLTATI